MNAKYKKLFSIMIAPILVFYFAFVPIAIFAQGLDDIVREPDVIGDFDIFNPESGRYLKELETAKPNEEVSGKQSNQQGSGDKPCGWLDIPCTIENLLNGIVNFILFLPLRISEYLLDWAIVANLNGAMYDSGFVRAGWGITRDVANMFFVFIVLWMALATIFQFESYSAKRLLPKLIIVALLVNFSLPIGLFVIRTSNALGKVFYDAATQGASLADQLEKTSAMTDVLFAVQNKKLADVGGANGGGVACKQQLDKLQSVGIWKRLVHGAGFAQADIDAATTAYNDCMIDAMREEFRRTPDPLVRTWSYALMSIFWKLIIGLVASFVFFAGAIFLLVRYLSLVILLIFGPLAFLFMVMPATQEHWNKWWNKLIQWSFFAPVFLFMIMLSVRVSKSILPLQVEANVSHPDAAIPSLALQYILVLGLFIASLMVAQSMGIAMSGTVVGWGRRMAFGAGRYAKGASFRGAARTGGRIAETALGTETARRMASLPGVRALLRPIELAAGAKKGVEEERAKTLAKAMATAPAEYAAARFRGERAAVQAGYLRSASAQDIQKLEKGMGADAMGGIIAQLKSISPELGRKIGNSFKDIDLRIAATKGVAIGTPEFDRAREEYMRERSPYEMGQVLIPENLEKDWVRTYLLKNAGEKEMNAIAQTGDQFRALALMLEQWANNKRADPASAVGVKINAVLKREAAAGVSPEEAMRVAIASNRAELAREMGGNQNFVTWLSAAPTGIMLQQGKFMGGKGENTEKLLARILEGQAQGGGGQSFGGANP